MPDLAELAVKAAEQLDRMILADLDRNPAGLTDKELAAGLAAWTTKSKINDRLKVLMSNQTLDTAQAERSIDGPHGRRVTTRVTVYVRRAAA